MDKLEKLIAQLCPNGVEYKPLGDLLDYEQPTKYIVRSTEYDDSYSTPVLTAGQTFVLGYTDEEDGHYSASKESPVIIFDDFTTATQWVDFEFKVKSSAMKILTLRDGTISDFRFVYYAIQCIQYKPGEHKRQWIEKYSKLEIPLPPLAVQKEIVRMLDGMAGLIGELEQELAARKQQYEWYRDKIKAIYLSGKVKRVSLSDLFDFYNGYTPRKSNSAFWENGTVPWFRLEDIRENGRMLSDSIQHVTCAAVKGDLFPADSLIVSTSATIGEYALITKPALTNQRFVVLHPKSTFATSLDPSFLLCMGREIGDYCKANINQGNFASVDMGAFKKFMFPLPPLAEQKEIVRKLDGMTGLIDELERERDARKQQYEYYRNRLLTFERAGLEVDEI